MVAAAEVHQLALDQLSAADREGRKPLIWRLRFDAWLALHRGLLFDVSGEPGNRTLLGLPVEVAALPLGMLIDLKSK